jgi:AraC-like DNA-binding protein
MSGRIETVVDTTWLAHRDDALLCRSSGWFERKFHQYERGEGYHTDVSAMVYVVDGTGHWASRELEGALGRGDLLCLPPGVWAWHDPDPVVGWEEHWCCFTGRIWESIAGDLFSDGPQVYRIGVDAALIESFIRLRSMMSRRQAGWRIEVAAQVHGLLARARVLRQRPSPEGGLAQACRALEEVISSSLDRPDVDVHAVALAHQVHYDSLRRAFKTLTGEAPKRYHTGLRLRAAADALCHEPNRPIADIAQNFGWDDPAWFTRHFASWKGCSPRDWRRQQVLEQQDGPWFDAYVGRSSRS